MKKVIALQMIGLLVLIGLLGGSAPTFALKIAIIPSIQDSNHSPDYTYYEGPAMNNVASRLVAKLNARGFETFNSAYNFATINSACDYARNWGANLTISNHTNACCANDTGWHPSHGTQTFYLVNWSGYSSPGDIDIANRCQQKMVAKFGALGVGYDGGTYAVNQGDIPWNAPGDHCLTEALFHDNWSDCQVLKSDAGKEAYAQALYEAVCDHYGWSYSRETYAYWPYKSNSQITVAPGNGLMEIFVKGANGNLYHAWQTSRNGYFTDWSNFGGTLASDPVAVINYSGGNEVFYRQTDGNLYHRWQNGPGGPWYGPESLGAVLGRPCVGRTADGHLEVFAHMSDNAIWHKWQDTSGAWGPWYSLGSWCTNDPIVGMTTIGSQELYIVGSGNQVYHKWQTAVGGAWTDWYSLGGIATPAGTVEMGKLATGSPDVFVQWADYGITHNWQVNGAWQGWSGLYLYPPSGAFPPVAGATTNGQQQIFAVNSDHSISTCFQNTNGSWSAWGSLGGYTTRSPLLSHHDNGGLAVFEFNPNGYMYANWQSGPWGSWTGWMQLGGQIF